MATLKLSILNSLMRPCKLLTLSIFLGFGLASCSGDDGQKVDEPVAEAADGGDAAPAEAATADAATPSTDDIAAAATDAAQTDAAPAEDKDAAPVAEAAAPADAGEQPVVALDESAPAVADAPSELPAEDAVASAPAPATPEASDTVSAELTDHKAVAPAASLGMADAGAATTASSSFDSQPAAAAAPATDANGDTVSTPGSAKFISGRHEHHAGGKHKHNHHNQNAQGDQGTASPAPMGKGDASYVVEAGDTLGRVSRKIYGSPKNWESLAALNKLSAPYLIRVGQSLQFDSSDAKAQAFVKGYQSNMKSVVVKKGDTLSKIAAQVYGNSGAWGRLLGYNRAKISNPNRIEVGMSLAYRDDGAKAAAAPDAAKTAAKDAAKEPAKDAKPAKADAKSKKKHKGHKKDAE